MSDHNKIDSNDLDRYITGNYGEDRFNDGLRECDHDQMDCPHYIRDKCGVDRCCYKEVRMRRKDDKGIITSRRE